MTRIDTHDSRPNAIGWGEAPGAIPPRVAVIMAFLLCASCSNATDVPENFKIVFDAALQSWAASRDSCANYQYDRYDTLARGQITTVAFDNGRPARRRLSIEGGASSPWVESTSEIGAHTEGFPAESVDDLLAECSGILRSDSNGSLVINHLGVPVQCARFGGGADAAPDGIFLNWSQCFKAPQF